MLESCGAVKGATVWDLFCGSGALGIEALSRGAMHVTFVDSSRGATLAARANLARLGYGEDRARVLCAEVLRWAHGLDGEPVARDAPSSLDQTLSGLTLGGPEADLVVDLVLADPPYAWSGWGALLAALAPLAPSVLMETSREPELPEPWRAVKAKRYGGTLITLAQLSDPVDQAGVPQAPQAPPPQETQGGGAAL